MSGEGYDDTVRTVLESQRDFLKDAEALTAEIDSLFLRGTGRRPGWSVASLRVSLPPEVRGTKAEPPSSIVLSEFGGAVPSQSEDNTKPEAVGRSERSAGWTGFTAAALGAAGDFFSNYREMRDANTIGADKYYHCLANCEATERGPGGKATALAIGYGREALDLFKNAARGMNLSDSLADGAEDLRANRIGREGALNRLRCETACRDFRPSGLIRPNQP